MGQQLDKPCLKKDKIAETLPKQCKQMLEIACNFVKLLRDIRNALTCCNTAWNCIKLLKMLINLLRDSLSIAWNISKCPNIA